MGDRDWHDWHSPYDDPASPLSQRLALVQQHLRGALDGCHGEAIRAISMCAGQGRDILGVLVDHPRGGQVRARLVELDDRNLMVARSAAAGLPGVEIVGLDAGVTDAYVGAVPADVVLACGVFGNISDQDIAQTIASLPSLCAPDATVIWTRHRRSPDLTPTIRQWFAEHDFVEQAFEGPPSTFFAVGVHRFVGTPTVLRPGKRLFTFIGYDSLIGRSGPDCVR